MAMLLSNRLISYRGRPLYSLTISYQHTTTSMLVQNRNENMKQKIIFKYNIISIKIVITMDENYPREKKPKL